MSKRRQSAIQPRVSQRLLGQPDRVYPESNRAGRMEALSHFGDWPNPTTPIRVGISIAPPVFGIRLSSSVTPFLIQNYGVGGIALKTNTDHVRKESLELPRYALPNPTL